MAFNTFRFGFFGSNNSKWSFKCHRLYRVHFIFKQHVNFHFENDFIKKIILYIEFNRYRCSPVGCIKVTNPSCTPTSTITDASLIAQISRTNCNSSCTVSSKPICSSSKMTSVFAKGINGVNAIKAIYCTDMYLVIQSNGMPNHNDSLTSIPRPPGGGGSGNYDSQCVTRSHVIQSFSFKIPLNPVALSTASATINNVNSFTGNMLSTAALPG